MFNKGDLVRYKDHCIQLEKAKENPAPFFVYSSKMVDLYGSGFKDHEIVEIQDANGEVFGDMEAEDLIVTVDGSKGLFDENGVRRPYDGLKYEVGEPNWYFHYSMPKFFDWPCFAQALPQFAKHLPAGSKLPKLADFHNRFMAIIETLSGREDVCGILNGPC
jgi:hypothetical protein